MGEDFMFDLEKMAIQFGGPLPQALNSSFNYLEHVDLGTKNTGMNNNFHSTHAPAKVQQFYTAQAVRKGLELLSIDYVTLGFEVPEWARQMLRDDVAWTWKSYVRATMRIICRRISKLCRRGWHSEAAVNRRI